jgi:hypothetical protein
MIREAAFLSVKLAVVSPEMAPEMAQNGSFIRFRIFGTNFVISEKGK